MKKAFVCLLAFMLVLVAFSSCDNSTTTPNPESGSTTTTPEPSTPTPGSGSSTETPKEATEIQFEAFKKCYGASLIGILSKMHGEPGSDVITLDGEVYSFSDFEIPNKDDESEALGTLKGKATITPNTLYLDVVYSDNAGGKISASGTITTSVPEEVFTINGDKCIITNAKIRDIGDGIYGSTTTP